MKSKLQTFQVSQSDTDALNHLARATGLTKSDLLRRMIPPQAQIAAAVAAWFLKSGPNAPGQIPLEFVQATTPAFLRVLMFSDKNHPLRTELILARTDEDVFRLFTMWANAKQDGGSLYTLVPLKDGSGFTEWRIQANFVHPDRDGDMTLAEFEQANNWPNYPARAPAGPEDDSED
jgi:hypothetical protein